MKTPTKQNKEKRLSVIETYFPSWGSTVQLDIYYPFPVKVVVYRIKPTKKVKKSLT